MEDTVAILQAFHISNAEGNYDGEGDEENGFEINIYT